MSDTERFVDGLERSPDPSSLARDEEDTAALADRAGVSLSEAWALLRQPLPEGGADPAPKCPAGHLCSPAQPLREE